MATLKKAHLIANVKSGRGLGATLPETAQKICDELGWHLTIYSGTTPEQFEKQIDLAVETAIKDRGIVIAAGGDGTLRSVAQKAVGRDVRFAAVAIGTFNFFAREHEVPEDPADAFRLALTGEASPVQVGEVNGHVFLINASLGLYARSIRDREARTRKFGRNRLVATLSTIFSMLRPQRLLRLEAVVDGKTRELNAPTVFVGNNALQLRKLAFNVADCVDRNVMAVVVLKPFRKIELLRILWRGITKTIENEANIDTFCASSLTLHTRRQTHDVALDGEMFHLTSPLKFRSRPEHLLMVKPPPSAEGPK